MLYQQNVGLVASGCHKTSGIILLFFSNNPKKQPAKINTHPCSDGKGYVWICIGHQKTIVPGPLSKVWQPTLRLSAPFVDDVDQPSHTSNSIGFLCPLKSPQSQNTTWQCSAKRVAVFQAGTLLGTARLAHEMLNSKRVCRPSG